MTWLSSILSALRPPSAAETAAPVPVGAPAVSAPPHAPAGKGLRERLTQQLRRDEGEVLHAYQDHLGYWTIGIGRLIDQRNGGGITPAESAYLLANDIERVEAEVRRRLPWFGRLDDARQGVLLNMAFQMGVAGLLGFVNTLAMVERGDYAGAAAGMLNSLWAQQTPARARRMSEQMRTGVWQ